MKHVKIKAPITRVVWSLKNNPATECAVEFDWRDGHARVGIGIKNGLLTLIFMQGWTIKKSGKGA
jgi:hypothetical protein